MKKLCINRAFWGSPGFTGLCSWSEVVADVESDRTVFTVARGRVANNRSKMDFLNIKDVCRFHVSGVVRIPFAVVLGPLDSQVDTEYQTSPVVPRDILLLKV